MADQPPSESQLPTSSIPPRPSSCVVYELPARLQYIASSDNITNPSVPMRVGQIHKFVRFENSSGEKRWIGSTSSYIFSSRWRGWDSPSISEKPNELLNGRVAYEVEVRRPCKSDYTTDRDEVKPTGRIVGTVLGGVNDGYCLVDMESWFTESENFTRGTWTTMAAGSLPPDVHVSVELADGITNLGRVA